MAYQLKNKTKRSPVGSVRTTRDLLEERRSQGSKVGMINLGCARNLVDSQAILGRLKKNGHRLVDIKDCDVAIVNTCSFVEDARQESIDVILELIELKKKGKIRKVIVAGCLAQRYGQELAEEFKQVDAFVGTPTLEKNRVPEQVSLTPEHYAYVKICESCYNKCSFCAIPNIKGKFSSKTIETVLSEVRALDQKGVKEIHIIGQDITAYGMDVYRKKSLARLLKEICAATTNVQWVRLLYAFPAHVDDELIDVMASEPKVCRYIDLPLQHVADPILRSMNRGITQAGTLELIKKLRTKIPGGSLRTTFIVGFPGETEDDFQQLLEFVRATRFERAGVFVYSREEGTPAYDYPDQVPESVKKDRLDALMQEQQSIAREIQGRFLGRRLKVLIDEKQNGTKGVYLGRTEFDAPEVDGLVYVNSRKALKSGDFVDVDITDSYEYDLTGEAVAPAV